MPGQFGVGDHIIKDLYFIVGSSLVTPLNPNETRLTFPIEDQLLSKFLSFYIDYEIEATSNSIINYFAGIIYGTSTVTAYQDYEPVISFSATGTPISTLSIQPFGFSIGDWKAQAFIEVQQCNLIGGCEIYTVATSTTIDFSINSTVCANEFCDPNVIIPYFNATSTGNIFQQCEQILGGGNIFLNFWGNGFCGGMKFMFEQHDFSYDFMVSTLNGFKSVFPFSAVYGIQQNTIDFLQTGTSTSPFAINIKLGNGHVANATILTSTMLEDNGLQEFKNIYFAIVEALK